jgi:hypothetical protein
MISFGSSKASEEFYPQWSRQVRLRRNDLEKFYQKDVVGRMTQSSSETVPKILSQDLYLCRSLHKIPILCNNWKNLPMSPK